MTVLVNENIELTKLHLLYGQVKVMYPLHSYTDPELLARIAMGDQAAFTEIFRRYNNSVRAAAFHLLQSTEATEDLVQEIFMHFWKNREKAVEIRDLTAFLFINTRNRALNIFRRQRLEQDYQSYLLQTISHIDALSADQLTVYNDLKASIEEAISLLPPQQQTAFRLSREQGLSHSEIAERMNISSRTVSDYILKALHHIRQFLHQRAAFTLALFLGFV